MRYWIVVALLIAGCTPSYECIDGKVWLHLSDNTWVNKRYECSTDEQIQEKYGELP